MQSILWEGTRYTEQTRPLLYHGTVELKLAFYCVFDPGASDSYHFDNFFNYKTLQAYYSDRSHSVCTLRQSHLFVPQMHFFLNTFVSQKYLITNGAVRYRVMERCPVYGTTVYVARFNIV
jgi:hypothetical protein